LLLQLALDKPQDFAVLSMVRDLVDIVEVGTPVLKRFGLSAISTVRELTRETPILVDTKTVDGGGQEADMVFGAGATFMTVLSSASRATHEAVGEHAAEHRGWVVVDTITESGKPDLLPPGAAFPDRFGYVAVHSPTDVRLAGDTSTGHVAAVTRVHSLGHRVSLAGGISPKSFDAVIAAEPEVLVIGSAITEADNPREVAEWIHDRLKNPGLGWPWDAN